MEISKMTVDDYEQVYELWMSTEGMGLNNLDDSKMGIEKYLNRNPETCFVAVAEKQVVGAILSGHDGRRGYIYHTAVLEELQSQGIGQALVQKAVSSLRGEGINKVVLVVFKKNKRGNQFWNKVGFTERYDLIYRNKLISHEEMLRIDT